MKNGLIYKGHEFGDWLALDQEVMSTETIKGRTDPYYITNIFQVNDLKILMEIAKILNKEEDEILYRQKYETMLTKVREEYFTLSGKLCYDTITAQVLALYFDIVPSQFKEKLAKELNDNMIKHCYEVVTGFIGTTFLLFTLTDNGYFETARRVLLNNAYPVWLYEVDMGATTIWERWNSLMPDGSPNPDGMNSYNHYAYGSVLDFISKRIAGLRPITPGYKFVEIAPHPYKGLSNIKSEFNSISDKFIVEYKQSDGKITYIFDIPNGVKTKIKLPNEDEDIVNEGHYEFVRNQENLSQMIFNEESIVDEIFRNPKAQKVFNIVFDNLFSGNEIAWMRNCTLQFVAEVRAKEDKMILEEFPSMLEKANKLFIEEINPFLN